MAVTWTSVFALLVISWLSPPFSCFQSTVRNFVARNFIFAFILSLFSKVSGSLPFALVL
jgi:hypothetical protein